MEYRRIGFACRCGSDAFRMDAVRQPTLDDVMTCCQCGRAKTCEAWHRDARRRAKKVGVRILEGAHHAAHGSTPGGDTPA